MSVENKIGGSELNIYPNPATEMLNIELENYSGQLALVRIIDITGQVNYIKNHYEGIIKIDLSNFNTGLYFVVVNIDEKSIVNKIQIVK